jgi:hypothetical protein
MKLNKINSKYTYMNITEIEHSGKIYALSDIHGDLHSFIIALRDCAKVITKNIDLDIEQYLSIDISNEDGSYIDTLGYSWCGDNSYIVIVGDMIDPSRVNECIRIDDKGNNKICGDYPQIEIKLLRFINAINKLALQQNGRIIKLLGNHELASILDPGNYRENMYKTDLKLDNYYHGYSRFETFTLNKPGFELLFEDKCYILIKINNTIFVHGRIPLRTEKLTITEINILNNFINDRFNKIRDQLMEDDGFDADDPFIKKAERTFESNWFENLAKIKEILSDRKLSDPEKVINNINKKYYTDLITNLKNFIGKEDVSELRVVLGHSPQYYSSTLNLNNTTFTHKMTEDYSSKTYSSLEYYTGKSINSDQDKIFGITMQCPKEIQDDCYTDFYIYIVDIGSSRGFDQLKEYQIISESSESNIDGKPETIINENKYLFSKTPQVLCIEQKGGHDFITVIKSKMRNTRIHLPRSNYEKLIKGHSSLNLDSSNYDLKYIKYKTKYLELKKIIKH